VANSAPTSERPDSETDPDVAGPRPARSWRGRIAAGLLALLVVVVAVALGSGSGATPPHTAAAGVVPADTLAYVNVSLDRGRPAVRQALAVAGRLPDFSLIGAGVLTKLGAVIGGGHLVGFSSQISPWLGGEAALALLNTTSSTAGSLLVLAVTDRARARAFLRSAGAFANGAYRGTGLLVYPSGTELAFVGNYLVLGQDASVRAAIDVAAGAAPSLAADPAYRRAASTEPPGRVLDAYASLAGVRRVLAPQGGFLGALGGLLYQPALQGVALSLVPTTAGAAIQVHSALDPTLVRVSGSPSPPFVPTLQDLMPSAATLMLDVTGLDRVAPQVLNAGSAAGIAGGLGPLLRRLGTALGSEGVNVKDIVSIFHREAAVGIIGGGQSPKLVIVARTADPARVQTELAQLEVPLAQLFQSPSKSSGSEPVFNDRQVAGITVHQLALTSGLQLDYAVFRGLVVISTSLQGIAAVAQQAHPLVRDPAFALTLGGRPKRVTSLVFARLGQLLGLGKQTGLTGSSTYNRLEPDLKKIGAVGLSSTRGPSESTAQLTVQIP
jgi:hypothetical protein